MSLLSQSRDINFLALVSPSGDISVGGGMFQEERSPHQSALQTVSGGQQEVLGDKLDTYVSGTFCVPVFSSFRSCIQPWPGTLSGEEGTEDEVPGNSGRNPVEL